MIIFFVWYQFSEGRRETFFYNHEVCILSSNTKIICIDKMWECSVFTYGLVIGVNVKTEVEQAHSPVEDRSWVCINNKLHNREALLTIVTMNKKKSDYKKSGFACPR